MRERRSAGAIFAFSGGPGSGPGSEASAYQNGVQRSTVMDVLAIVLRDELIRRRNVRLERADSLIG